MQAADLETLVPGLAEQRAKERSNRAFAFSGLTHTLCGVEIVALRPETRLRLQLLGNAFALDVEPLAGDLFVFLWLLSPRWAAGGLASRFWQWRLRRRVRRLDLAVAAPEVREYVTAQLQDGPGSATAGDGADNSAYLHWMAAEAGFWINIHGGFTLEAYARTPYLVLQQLFRVWQVNHPIVRRNVDGTTEVEEPLFVNASDAIVARWHRSHRDAIAAAILAQREKPS